MTTNRQLRDSSIAMIELLLTLGDLDALLYNGDGRDVWLRKALTGLREIGTLHHSSGFGSNLFESVLGGAWDQPAHGAIITTAENIEHNALEVIEQHPDLATRIGLHDAHAKYVEQIRRAWTVQKIVHKDDDDPKVQEMGKSALIATAAQYGVQVDQSMTAAEIRKRVEDAIRSPR